MATNRPEIVMFARERFCPDVTRARHRLTELGYEWTEHDVEADEDRRAEMEAITNKPNVPTLIIGESVLVEPSTEEIDGALKKAGYEVDDIA